MVASLVVGLAQFNDPQKSQVIAKTNEWHSLWMKQRADPENPQHFPDLLMSDMSLAGEAA
eukprot:5873254-Alexandrium_andersonii.AAC.1